MFAKSITLLLNFQLCINAANEHGLAFCASFGLKILICFRPLGLFSILDEESKFPSANDSTFTAKLDTHLKEKSNGIYSRFDLLLKWNLV